MNLIVSVSREEKCSLIYSVNIPNKLLELYQGQSEKSKNFLHNIRAFNNFEFTSLKVNLDLKYTRNNKGIYTSFLSTRTSLPLHK
ncbi:hypothetical protein RHMOL_Rhmol04G0182700 [Rhododendron molle]|uniref:Uncharacterized protein n=1 Tax=Rhododendron molle TaxID=49168 RepID=A0ACC0P3J7_RHOML|nr:hypothetical protein RHMOL_Rhmol04G0182700 [Rhododendron molle]